MTGLSIRGVHKTYPNGVEVLKGIDIDIAEGQFLILVGSSGCGKSTLLNMIAGLETISRGEIWIGGRLVNDLPPKSRDIAMVFQSYALYPTMTVRENISFGLEVRKIAQAEQKRIVDTVAESLQISHLLDRRPRQLSGGQRQRVAMGRALARNPTLFLFDEPLSNLDAQLRLEMRAEIKMMHRRLGKTICYVTHDQIEAMTLGDRIAVMKDGVVQQLGNPREIYDAPANMYVAGFIGAPPMNFVPGKLEKAGAGYGISVDTRVARGSLRCISLDGNYDAHVGEDVVLGIRPERITDSLSVREGLAELQMLEVKVDLVEPTGPDTLVFTELNGRRALCRVHPGAEPRPGQSAKLAFDLSKSVLFDPVTGARLTKAGA
ncbi:MAG: sn-glycerol-3-phosphate ABC transporter ATP-binding protein UgpC [Alphaproteobacteria bacterium]|nr:sn-glycerol-3-phosphate ABC transporter ATP-binding protein UgpC [Alphaproteobacteria bacterium]